jgi:hypothetical protein
MLPAYLCGECGIELQQDRSAAPKDSVENASVLVRCYTPRCAQKGVQMRVTLVAAPVVSMQTELPLET